MQRIALISEHASPLAATGAIDSGGQNIYVAQLARHLAARGHQVDVFTRRDRSDLPPVVEWQANLRVVHVPAGPASYIAKEHLLPTMTDFGDFLYRYIGRESRPYDVLHANFFMSGLAAKKSAAAYGIPLVMTFHALGRVRRLHQPRSDRFPTTRLAIESDLVRIADRIIAECPQDRADLLNLYQADAHRIDVIPCGFEPQELPPLGRDHARRMLGWDPRRYTLLQLGRMVPRKGIENVVRALALLRDRHGVDAQLYVVGGDSETPDAQRTPEIGRLGEIARGLGVDSDVHFLGRRNREALNALYRAADVFVTTPWYEPFGITAVEAMACSVPVVGSAVGGIRTTVVDHITGRLVPPEEPQALAEVLAHLAARPDLRAAYGRAGMRRARLLYTWKRITRNVLDCYRQARRARTAIPAIDSVAATRPVPALQVSA